MFVLDTNVISELRRAGDGLAHPAVVAWQAAVPANSTYLSVVTCLELERGILLIQRRDKSQAATLHQWLTDCVLPEFAGRILPIDTEVALRCAALHVPDPRPERDALIAATALVHGMTIVTCNTADFAATGARLLNPWKIP